MPPTSTLEHEPPFQHGQYVKFNIGHLSKTRDQKTSAAQYLGRNETTSILHGTVLSCSDGFTTLLSHVVKDRTIKVPNSMLVDATPTDMDGMPIQKGARLALLINKKLVHGTVREILGFDNIGNGNYETGILFSPDPASDGRRSSNIANYEPKTRLAMDPPIAQGKSGNGLRRVG